MGAKTLSRDPYVVRRNSIWLAEGKSMTGVLCGLPLTSKSPFDSFKSLLVIALCHPGVQTSHLQPFKECLAKVRL